MRLPQLSGTNVRLRPLKRSDVPVIAKNANNRTISKFMPPIPYPYSTDHARKWVNRVQRLARNDASYQFGIERQSQDGIIGMMGLNNLNWADKNGELEYWLGGHFRRRSYATEALRLLLGLAFGELDLHRVYAITVALNIPSTRLLERHGFVREATWRKASWMDGRWHDVYCYGMLDEEAGQFK